MKSKCCPGSEDDGLRFTPVLETLMNQLPAPAVVCVEQVPAVSQVRVPPRVGCLLCSEFVPKEMEGEEEDFSLSTHSPLGLLPLLLNPNSSQRSQPQSSNVPEEEVLYMLKLSPRQNSKTKAAASV